MKISKQEEEVVVIIVFTIMISAIVAGITLTIIGILKGYI
jgi:NhaP-type Na+/H+ or K+/H+ antiporter